MNNQLLILGTSIVVFGLIAFGWYWRRRHHQALKRLKEVADLDADSESLDSVTTSDEPSPKTAVAPVSPPVDKGTMPRPQELIIVLYVIAQTKAGFAGTDIFTILEELGLKYGEMKIFHHYGVGELKMKQSIFSVANIVEPGTFDPKQMETFTSPGLALFMQLPGPFGGRVAFELMLNSGQRLAEVLEGKLIDERQRLLNQAVISEIRARIAHFEQR